MTNYTTFSDSELTEALNFHRRQRNMSRGINEAAHARQTLMVRMLEAEEARRLNEEKPNKYVIYKHKDKYGVSQDIGTGYNWDHSYHHGYHDTVDAAKAWAAKHAGKYPHKIEVKEEVEINEASLLGPEGAIHKQASADQSDREYLKQMAFKNAWKAKNPGKTWPGYEKAGFKEEVEHIDEISKSTLGSYLRKARTSKNVAGDELQRQSVKMMFKDKRSDAEKERGNAAAHTYGKRSAGISTALKQISRKVQEEVELDEASNNDASGKTPYWNKPTTAVNPGKTPYWNKPTDKKEEVELDEASDLRITKIYNKWPKKATYAVHTPDRKYFKEFDSIEAAKAHHDEKTNNK